MHCKRQLVLVRLAGLRKFDPGINYFIDVAKKLIL